MRRLLDWISSKTGVVMINDLLKHPGTPGVVTLRRMPGYRQTDSFSCGLIAAAMVLHCFFPRRSLNRLAEMVRPDPENGTTTARMKSALRKSGIAVTDHEDLKWQDIRRAITNGQPVVVSVNSRKATELHWVVIYGAAKRPNRVFLAGHGIPWVGKKEFSYYEFRTAMWNPVGNGLICRKRQRPLARPAFKHRITVGMKRTDSHSAVGVR